MKHPKLYVLIKKLKTIISYSLIKYKEKTLLEDDIKYKDNYIINKVLYFLNKYNLINNINITYDSIHKIYKDNINEIYELIIFIWIDVIHDNEDNDEELLELSLKLQNKIFGKTNYDIDYIGSREIIKSETYINDM